MAFIVPIFMLSIAYFTGLTVMKLFCDDKTSIIETCLVGTFFLMIISQTTVLICYYLGFSFGTYVRILCMVMILLLILSLFICQKEFLYHIRIRKKVNKNAVAIIVFMGAIEFLALILLMPDVAGDFTADSVNTLLATNTIFYGCGRIPSLYQSGQTALCLPIGSFSTNKQTGGRFRRQTP